MEQKKNNGGSGSVFWGIVFIALIGFGVYMYNTHFNSSDSRKSEKETSAQSSQTETRSEYESRVEYETYIEQRSQPEQTTAAPQYVQPDAHEKTNEYTTYSSDYGRNRVNHSYYALFNDKQRRIYTLMEYSVGNVLSEKFGYRYKTEYFYLSGSDTLKAKYDIDLDLAYEAFCLDNPQVFWLDGYNYSTVSGVTTVSILSRYSPEETNRMKAELNDKVRDFCRSLYTSMSEYDRVKYIHNYVIDRVVYNKNVKDLTTDDQIKNYKAEHPEVTNAYGALVNGDTICTGYSRTFQLLCRCAGLDCVYVRGKADIDGNFSKEGTGHAWNAVCIYGDWYMVDTTYDDVENPALRYVYLNVTKQQLSRDHFWEVTSSYVTDLTGLQTNLFIPSCTATRYNYYIYDSECRKITSLEDNQIGAAMLDAVYSGNTMVALYIDPSVIKPGRAEELLFKMGDNSYIHRFLNYVRNNSNLRCNHYTYWCNYYPGVFYIRIDE